MQKGSPPNPADAPASRHTADNVHIRLSTSIDIYRCDDYRTIGPSARSADPSSLAGSDSEPGPSTSQEIVNRARPRCMRRRQTVASSPSHAQLELAQRCRQLILLLSPVLGGQDEGLLTPTPVGGQSDGSASTEGFLARRHIFSAVLYFIYDASRPFIRSRDTDEGMPARPSASQRRPVSSRDANSAVDASGVPNKPARVFLSSSLRSASTLCTHYSSRRHVSWSAYYMCISSLKNSQGSFASDELKRMNEGRGDADRQNRCRQRDDWILGVVQPPTPSPPTSP